MAEPLPIPNLPAKRLKKVFATALCLVAVGVWVAFHGSSGRPLLSVPIRMEDNRAFIATDLGDAFLDTGTPLAVIDEQLVQANHARLRWLAETATFKDLAGVTMQMKVAALENLVIPARDPTKNLEIKGMRVLVAKDLKKNAGVSFVLGLSFFEGLVVELDFPSSEMRILRNLPFGLNCQSVTLKDLEGSAALAVKVADRSIVDGLIDTGFLGFFHFRDEDWPKVPLVTNSKRPGKGRGFYGSFSSDTAVASGTITAGNLSVENSPVSHISGSRWNLVGMLSLKRTRLAIDWDRRKAVFRTPYLIYNHMNLTMDEPVRDELLEQ